MEKNINRNVWSPLVVQWVKDPALSLPPLRSLLWCRFDPWPENFHMLQAQQPKKNVSMYNNCCAAKIDTAFQFLKFLIFKLKKSLAMMKPSGNDANLSIKISFLTSAGSGGKKKKKKRLCPHPCLVQSQGFSEE